MAACSDSIASPATENISSEHALDPLESCASDAFSTIEHKTIAVVDKVARVRPCRLKTLRGLNWLVAKVVRVYHKPKIS